MNISEQRQASTDERMQVKRTLGRIFVFLERTCMKKCSLIRVMSIVGGALLTWSAVLLITSPELMPHLQHRLTNDSLIKSRGNSINMKLLSSVDEWRRTEHTDLYEHVVQNNPLGTYFSDRLAGNTPIGTSHLDFNKNDHHKPLKMVLIFVEDTTPSSMTVLGNMFAQQRIEYRFTDVTKELPSLVVEDIGLPRYSLIVFDEYVTYLSMDLTRRTALDNYCKMYQVGILAATRSSRNAEIEFFSDIKLKLQHRMKLVTFKLNPLSDIWRVAKPEEIYTDPLPSSDWTVFITDHETYKPLVFSTVTRDWSGSSNDVDISEFGCTVALHDQGLMDGIQRIIFGYDLQFWPNSIVAMDAVTHLTTGRLSCPLTRLLQIDVDDMFVGVSGIRTLVKDAEAMMDSQNRIREHVPDFNYTLGFSGEYYMGGTQAEVEGDRKIVELAQHFVWFNHMYRHEQPHLFDQARLVSSMDRNDHFAQEHKLPVTRDYMVTPHHSGVYPVYEALYKVWTKRGVNCTSTTEYPHPHPIWNRRGFIYRGIKVLPRQVCNLYTSINRFEDFKGGKSSLDSSIRGDFLFKVFLYTPVMVFMTHMSNYANDQLAEYMFENVIKFVTKWTNLKIVAPPPSQIAKQYFEMYPSEATPVWVNPCDQNRHIEILPPHVNCAKFPSFIIVGPQKSGTTALQKFLQAHPVLVSTIDDPTYFEEVQFFSSSNYLNGLDWYQNHFPQPLNDGVLLFEKSANYFDSEVAPKRISNLLPNVKIIIILAEPVRRAYSWYQHVRSRNDPVAMNYTFFEIVSAPCTAPRFLLDARTKCLKAGAYATHLARWLQFFPKEQIYLVDGDLLTKNPVLALNQLQKFLKVVPYVDFNTKLRFDSVKGFFCRMDTGCLGSVKGRKYLPMDPESRSYLETYFTDHNTNLKIVLNHIGQAYPQWLVESSPH